jgi:hypothetical protein
MIQLTSAQRNLLSRLDVNISTGLSTSEANSRRRNRPQSSSSSSSAASNNTTNTVTPPINCPKWICCLLPCITKTHSMVSFAAVTPDDAEVLRNAHWIRYDAASLVVGDVIRLDNYDIVPADCVILAYGFHDQLEVISNEIEDADEKEKLLLPSKAAAAAIDNNNHDECEEEGLLTVDARLITGESNMTHYSPSSSSSTSSSKSSLQTLLYGSQIVNGSCIALVTAIGNNVVLSKLITSKRWPPKYDMSHEIYDIFNMEINNL